MFYVLRYTLLILCCWHISPALADVLQHRFSPKQDYHDRVIPWNEKHNEGVIRQKLDASCGAAALATILKYYYGLNVSEEDMMKSAEKEEWFSFADMAEVLKEYDFEGVGLALNFDQLTKLKVPAVVYIKTRSLPHFAVLRSIDEDHVMLADPAHGNNRYPVDKFLEKWNTRSDPKHKGKILVPIPKKTAQHVKINSDYFNNSKAKNFLEERLVNIQRNLLFY